MSARGETEDPAAIELRALQKEWRVQVSESLRELRDTGKQITEELSMIRTEFAPHQDVKALTGRVEEIEKERAKLVGGLVVIQAIGAAVLWIINKKWQG